MEKEVKWTSRSELNLFSIFQYIAQDSEIYAERFVTRLIKHMIWNHSQKLYVSEREKQSKLE